MENQHLSYFQVHNFKKFDFLEVSEIGQFNLIVGDNNSGKTTFLESLVFDDSNYHQFLRNLWASLSQARHITIPDGNSVNYLDFYLNDKNSPIEYRYSYTNSKEQKLIARKVLLSELDSLSLESLKDKIIIHKGTQHLIQFVLNDKVDNIFITYGNEPGTFQSYIPFIFFGLNYQTDLIDFFSETTQQSTKKLAELVETLKFMIPNIKSIEISTAVMPKNPILIIREENEDNPKAISMYGDGLNKVLRYILEINKCRNKRLMIDEIDTGIHHSRMKDFWKIILRTSMENNVQLFTTTHSKECVENYTVALQELKMESKGRIIRLSDTKTGIKSYTMKYEEFSNSLEAESEIR